MIQLDIVIRKIYIERTETNIFVTHADDRFEIGEKFSRTALMYCRSVVKYEIFPFSSFSWRAIKQFVISPFT